jgi:pSer/pThr/pTyr-binding forkhead associated (FHA) protein
MARLIVKSGENTGREYNLQDVTTAGRLAANPVYINDALASREHCRIVKEADGYYVIDLESNNGTRVNGEKITRKKLFSGDIVRIGHVDLMFEADETVSPGKTIATEPEKPASVIETAKEAKKAAHPGQETLASRMLFLVLTLCCLAILVFLSRSIGYSWAKRMLAGIKPGMSDTNK